MDMNGEPEASWIPPVIGMDEGDDRSEECLIGEGASITNRINAGYRTDQ
jgi:hypothetical protein